MERGYQSKGDLSKPMGGAQVSDKIKKAMAKKPMGRGK